MDDWITHRLSAARLQFLEVFKSPLLFAIMFFSALALFSFNILITNYQILFQTHSLSLAWQFLIGSLDSVMQINLFLIVLNSILGGFMVALLFMGISIRIATSPVKTGFSKILGVVGVAAGMGLPSCATCGLGLLSALGYGGVFLLLPFRGIELSILSASLLLFSFLQLSYTLTFTSCEIKK